MHPWAWRTGARHGQNLVDVHVDVHVVHVVVHVVVRRAPPVFMNKMPPRAAPAATITLLPPRHGSKVSAAN